MRRKEREICEFEVDLNSFCVCSLISLATIHPAGYYREECNSTGLLATATVEKW